MKTLTIQELRIGNKILDWNDSIVTVKSIEFPIALKKYFIGVNESHSRYTEGDVHPITLTEDILLRFGFSYHKSEDCIYYSKTFGKNGIIIITKDYHYTGFEFELGKGVFKSIEFVHNLQNGYHFLTGSELILK